MTSLHTRIHFSGTKLKEENNFVRTFIKHSFLVIVQQKHICEKFHFMGMFSYCIMHYDKISLEIPCNLILYDQREAITDTSLNS